jgi:C1A family cysteine protease
MAQKKRKKKQPVLTVSQIPAMIKKEGLRWEPNTESELALLPLSEQKKRLGLKVTAGEIKKMADAVKREAAKETRAFAAGAEPGAPAACDWTNVGGKDYVHEAQNQGPCGSCVSFGTCAAIESNWRIKSQNDTLNINLSEAFMQFCGGGSCSGWGLTSGLAYAKSTGVTDEACFPYQPKNMPCSDRCSDWQSRLKKIKSYTSHSSMQARKDAIAGIGPVVAGMAVYNDFYSYSGGIYEKISTSSLVGYHCICVVGYNDSQQYWIIKNSWGTGWGINGFCHIAYGQADLLIDSSWAFYSVDPDVEPAKGSGPAKHILIDKYFGGGVRLWAYAGGKWRHKNIPDAELSGIAQELFAANRVDVWWDQDQITLVRAWKSP